MDAKTSKINLLYVDQDHINRFAFHANFRRKYGQIFLTDNLEEAIRITNDYTIHVAFIDQRTLVESSFLNQVFGVKPKLIVLSSGMYLEELELLPDWEKAFECVTKPWKTGQVLDVVEKACAAFGRLQELI